MIGVEEFHYFVVKGELVAELFLKVKLLERPMSDA